MVEDGGGVCMDTIGDVLGEISAAATVAAAGGCERAPRGGLLGEAGEILLKAENVPSNASGRGGDRELRKDVLLIIFKDLGVENMRHILLVCWQWRRVALDPILPVWRTLNGETFSALDAKAEVPALSLSSV